MSAMRVVRLRDVGTSLVCWLRRCNVPGQFCTRCGRFIP